MDHVNDQKILSSFHFTGTRDIAGSNTLGILTNSSVPEGARACYHEPKCVSFDFCNETKTCYLNEAQQFPLWGEHSWGGELKGRHYAKTTATDYMSIKSVFSGEVLAINRYLKNIEMKTFDGSSDSFWKFVPAGSGKYFLSSVSTGHVLDVPHENNILTAYPYLHRGENQRFEMFSFFLIIF